jgi:two-component system sensor histidine kinase RegB
MQVPLISSLTQITQARLINLRWLSVLAMLAAALISPNILGSSALMPRLLAFATFIAAINACLLLAVFFNRGSGESLPMFSPQFQLVFDLTSWGSYIYLSGGATNPLISVFLPLVAIGTIVLGKVQAWLYGLAAILTYTFLWRFYQPLAIADAQTATRLHLLGMWLVFVVSAIVVIWFILQMTKAIHERDAALAEAREQAIRNDWLVSMGSLAAGAAHELSTPLGTMNILIDDWLDNVGLPSEQRADYELMHAQIETCKQALAQLTRRAGNPRSEQTEQMAAGTWLNAVLAAWSTLNPDASLEIEATEELNEHLVFLDITIERALANLLDNAHGADATKIVVSAGITSVSLTIQIDDNAAGISNSALQSFNLGAPFASDNGMGIGLLLSRTAVERKGGKLTLECLPKRGTRACLVLPLNVAQKESPHES